MKKDRLGSEGVKQTLFPILILGRSCRSLNSGEKVPKHLKGTELHFGGKRLIPTTISNE